MSDPDKILVEMEKIMQKLILNAEKMNDLTQQTISKEDIMPLQKEQDQLMKKLVDADTRFETACNGNSKEYRSPTRDKINKMLETFEQINENFIQHLSTRKGIINFDQKQNPNNNSTKPPK